MEDKSGIVYVLKNEAMPGYVKIGTTKELKQAIASLDTPGVPLPFECFYARYVANAEFTESRLHAVFAAMRVRKSRRFFKVVPEQVKAALEIAPGEEVAIQRAVLESEDDLESLAEAIASTTTSG